VSGWWHEADLTVQAGSRDAEPLEDVELMPAVLDKFVCPSCGNKHDLCLLVTDSLDARGDYEFNCPRTGKVVPFKTEKWDRVTILCPPGYLRVRTVE
jgi:hypothetical protein